MKKYILFFLICIPLALFSQENKGRKISVQGSVEDYVTHNLLPGTKAALMSRDSTVIDTMTVKQYTYYTGVQQYNVARFDFKVSEGDYIIKLQHEGYDTQYVTFSVDKIRRREIERRLPTVYMKKEKIHTIEEVTVTATKVKLYYKGDTVVFNADAFQTAEGSTLNALVKQLPGVELKSNGQIFVNGRFVESLLLNGKDFFKDNSIMLENLPTYSVKDIQVYEKKGDLSLFAGTDMRDQRYVMDVKLKKQYNTGWMGNMDVGGALPDLYLGRLFVMRNTDHSNMTFFGNLNNLNDATTPTSSDWTPDKMPFGRLRTQKLGLRLNIDDRYKRFKLNSNASYTHYDNRQGESTYKTNFLSTGDTYERIMNDAHYRNTFISTSNKLSINPEGRHSRFSLDVTLDAGYNRYRHDFANASGLSGQSLDDFGKELKDSLTAPVITPELRKKLINRSVSNAKRESDDWNVGTSVSAMVKIGHTNDVLQFYGQASINGDKGKMFSHDLYDYPSDASKPTDFRNQYSSYNTKNNYSYVGVARYYLNLKRDLSIYLTYQYEQKYTNSTNNLYRLDGLDGWGIGTENAVGTLPSVTEYQSTIDRNNSYKNVFRDGKHHPYIYMYWKFGERKNSYWQFDGALNFPIYDQRLSYRRAKVDTTATRSKAFIEPRLTLKWNGSDRHQGLTLDYNLSHGMPSLNYGLGYTDDTDPLNIRVYDDANLRNSLSHNASVSYNDSRRSVSYNIRLTYNVTDNAVAMGFVYDPSTGRRTYSPTNLNGNWNTSASLSFTGNVDKKKRLYFTTVTNWSYSNSVDMMSTTQNMSSVKSTVKTSSLQQYARLSYRIGQNSVGLTGSFSWTNSNGDMEGFYKLNAYDYNYGLEAVASLPWKFQLSTDLNMYSRRGYEYSSMNTDDIVWNARLSRPFWKGRIVLMADAFDIFHQLQKIDRYVNAQGRVEKFYNPMKRYVLLHAVLKLDIKPKKRN